MNARTRFLAFGFWLLAMGLLFAQNSRFELFLRSTSNTAVTGATVYVVHMTTGDSLLLSEVSGKNGYYRRDNVEFGNYKIYVNGSLSTTQKFHPTDRIYLTLTGIDADGDYLIDSGSFEAGAIDVADLSPATKAYVATGGSFTSDSLRDMVGDSVAVLSADNVTIINDGTFKQRVVNDTTFLDAIKADSVGTEINLKQLSSSNTLGGGTLVYRTSGHTVDMMTVFKAQTGYWVRKDYLENNYVDPQWGGLKADGSTDNYAPLQAAVTLAKSQKRILRLPGGTIKTSQQIVWPVAQSEGGRIEGVAAGTGNNGRTILWGDGCSPLKITKTSSQGANFSISNITVFRDTTTIARADTGIILDFIVNSRLENVAVQGYDIGVLGIWCGNITLNNPALSFNKVGFKEIDHSDGVSIYNGLVSQNDSIGASFYFAGGFTIMGTELSHQPVAVKLEASSTGSIIGGRYENSDSSTYQIGSGCILNVYGASLLPGTKGIIAELLDGTSYLNLYDPAFAGDYSGFDSTIIVAAITNNYVSLNEHYKNNIHSSYIKVYDQFLNMIYTPGPFRQSPATSNPGTSALTAGQLWQGHFRQGQNSSSYLAFIQENTENGGYFANRLTDNTDVRYASDSTGTRLDRMRTRRLRKSLTLAASGNVTRDTLYVDKFVSNSDYGWAVTVMAGTDSLIVPKVYSRNSATGQVIVSFYHPTINGTSIQYYLAPTYQANKWDYP